MDVPSDKLKTKKYKRMKKIILLISLSLIFICSNAQKDTLKPYYRKSFLKEMKVYKIDSVKIYKQFTNTSKTLFFSKTLYDIYKNNKLSEKNSFYVVIFTFSELKKLIPNYKKLKDSIFTDSTTMFLKPIIEKYIMQKQEFEQKMLIEEEQQMQNQINNLEDENNIVNKDIIKKEEVIENDSINIIKENTEITDKNSKNNLEKKLDAEEQKLKEEEQKILKEKKRLEIKEID